MQKDKIMINKISSLFITVCTFGLILNPLYVAHSAKLINQNDLEYEGAFRVPKHNLGGQSTNSDTLGYGGALLTYNPARQSLFIMAGHEKLIMEISIPQIINSTNINNLSTATLIQTPVDIGNNNWNFIMKTTNQDGEIIQDTVNQIENGGSPAGLLVTTNNRLIGSVVGYYDGRNEGAYSHFSASANWTEEGVQYQNIKRVGLNPVNPADSNGGFVGGFMSSIPEAWQSSLGGPALTGNGALNIISRTSYGPCAWVFNPADISTYDPVPAKMLVGYTSGHQTLGGYVDAPSLYFNRMTQLGGMVFPTGSDSVLFFGRQGLGRTGQGDSCYGAGASMESLDNTFPGEIQTNSTTSNSLGSGTYTFTIPTGLNITNGVGIIVKPTSNNLFHMEGTVTSYNSSNGVLVTNMFESSTLGTGTYSDWEVHIAVATGNPSVRYCYDPVDPSKGRHSYPYVYYIWAYDANDLAKVQNETINPTTGQPYQPWDILPYAMWSLNLPFGVANAKIYGATYDSSTQRLFISQYDGDKPEVEPYPVIYAYKLNLSSAFKNHGSPKSMMSRPPS